MTSDVHFLQTLAEARRDTFLAEARTARLARLARRWRRLRVPPVPPPPREHAQTTRVGRYRAPAPR